MTEVVTIAAPSQALQAESAYNSLSAGESDRAMRPAYERALGGADDAEVQKKNQAAVDVES